jgi:NADH-quinone oxidoreductase subunit G
MEDRGNWVTFSIDDREVSAPEGEWLLDAAKRGDVEIPYFCYEPKLGPPVGACRMCVVEIEGIPKLQVSCATPVKDGMVVFTQTERVKHAQNAVVEFLLINHPLDCPVCDKGGECPLQDISYGWGPGRSRFVEQKRNFPKPIALSPLVAIDRERCILCYRCVRFSQEIAEDDQLMFLERADHTFVGTFDGRPYVAPFSGNIIELCPVGALTSNAYRFRARPWEIENAGSVCTLCPSQCNIKFTVRDDRVERVLARDNPHVDDGWLCDLGRFGYGTIHSEQRITQPLVRDGGHLRPATWERALEVAAEGLRRAGARAAALAGDATTNEEGFLLGRLFREALGSPHVNSRGGPPRDPSLARMLAHPSLSAAVSDIDRAAVVVAIGVDPINEAPIVDLRIRKAVRRFGARLVVASPQPTALDGGATERTSHAPGAEEALLRALSRAMLDVEDERPPEPRPSEAPAGGAGEPGTPGQPLKGQVEVLSFLEDQPLERLAALAGADGADLRDAAALLVGAESIVVLWSERLGRGERGAETLSALVDFALLAGVDGGVGSGLIEIPAAANGRGLGEVGCTSNLGPGFSDVAEGLSAAEVPGAVAGSEVRALYLLHADPLRDYPDGEAWERALAGAGAVVAHANFLTEGLERHADVVFPAESYAEKEGTVTHPDGRLQRLRPAIGRPGEVRPGWRVLAELAGRLGLELPYLTATMVLDEIGQHVPFYRGLDADAIGPQGVRWPALEKSVAAAREVIPELRFGRPELPSEPPRPGEGELRLATVPNLWASPVAEQAPALRFLSPSQELELNPADAERLGEAQGERVGVASNGHSIAATIRLRAAAREGTAYLVAGSSSENANVLVDGRPVLVRIEPERVPDRS